MIAFHFSELHIRDILSWKNCNIKTKKCSNKKCINLRSSEGLKAIYGTYLVRKALKSCFLSLIYVPLLNLVFLMWWCTLGSKANLKEHSYFLLMHLDFMNFSSTYIHSHCKAISVLKEYFFFVAVIFLIFWNSTRFFKTTTTK